MARSFYHFETDEHAMRLDRPRHSYGLVFAAGDIFTFSGNSAVALIVGVGILTPPSVDNLRGSLERRFENLLDGDGGRPSAQLALFETCRINTGRCLTAGLEGVVWLLKYWRLDEYSSLLVNLYTAT